MLQKNNKKHLDFADYIKYSVFYEKEKTENGQATAKRKRQKKPDCNAETKKV